MGLLSAPFKGIQIIPLTRRLIPSLARSLVLLRLVPLPVPLLVPLLLSLSLSSFLLISPVCGDPLTISNWPISPSSRHESSPPFVLLRAFLLQVLISVLLYPRKHLKPDYGYYNSNSNSNSITYGGLETLSGREGEGTTLVLPLPKIWSQLLKLVFFSEIYMLQLKSILKYH